MVDAHVTAGAAAVPPVLNGRGKKKTNQRQKNQLNKCWKRQQYLANKGLCGNGDMETHRADFTELTLRFTDCSALMTAN